MQFLLSCFLCNRPLCRRWNHIGLKVLRYISSSIQEHVDIRNKHFLMDSLLSVTQPIKPFSPIYVKRMAVNQVTVSYQLGP